MAKLTYAIRVVFFISLVLGQKAQLRPLVLPHLRWCSINRLLRLCAFGMLACSAWLPHLWLDILAKTLLACNWANRSWLYWKLTFGNLFCLPNSALELGLPLCGLYQPATTTVVRLQQVLRTPERFELEKPVGCPRAPLVPEKRERWTRSVVRG